MRIIGIDPGPTQSGFVILDGRRVDTSSTMPNYAMREALRSDQRLLSADMLAIEMIEGRGMAVGADVFETCVWVGRFMECWAGECVRIKRRDVKLRLCGSTRAKDANVRQALIDEIGPRGTKKAPGPTYGVSGHAWAALGVAFVLAEHWTPARPSDLSAFVDDMRKVPGSGWNAAADAQAELQTIR